MQRCIMGEVWILGGVAGWMWWARDQKCLGFSMDWKPCGENGIGGIPNGVPKTFVADVASFRNESLPRGFCEEMPQELTAKASYVQPPEQIEILCIFLVSGFSQRQNESQIQSQMGGF